MRNIILIAHNLRSCHNVGSLLRTADGLGVEKVYLTGYTPYPKIEHDDRLPHLANKISAQIHKTALGAEDFVTWNHESNIVQVLTSLKRAGYTIVALEQAKHSINLNEFKPVERVALVVGREVEGIEPEVLELADTIVEIPMFGRKESFNVVQAAAMAAYHYRFA
jgi:tRNA G18 (ribose-2'-O)-methylase SpoU